MHGVSFVKGFPLPPISMVLEKLRAVALPNHSGGYSLVCNAPFPEKRTEIKDYVRTDVPNNRIVLLEEHSFKDSYKYLGPLETIVELVHPYGFDAPLAYTNAFRWIVRNIEGYAGYTKWPHVFAVPIVNMDWTKDIAQEELQELFKDMPNSPINND